ncbi:hypothetical protein HHI36_011849 [Cryptolaemus montrouzieri]|uniref:Uncharacterized protein n=1 Tax=Cryptolaemus montrouzieri TaxID=559131 RepID=A0ABD2NCJ4_9CUCU
MKKRSDYKEPTDPEEHARTLIAAGLETWSGAIRTVDPYLRYADGYSYNSYERYLVQRRKHLRLRSAPADIYRVPVTCSMEIGFWHTDPDLKNEDWFKPSRSACFHLKRPKYCDVTISPELVEAAIKGLKSNMSPGQDGISV